MDSILKVLREQVECRTPIVVMREHTVEGTSEAGVALVMRIAAHSDAYVEHVHGARDDELAAIGKKIDNSIINGDWLVVSFGKQFSTMDFLRFVGRRLFTIMPDVERRPNMELFRLWLCLDTTVVLPQVFQKVAVHVNLQPLSLSQRADADVETPSMCAASGSGMPIDTRPSTAASRPPTAPASSLAAAARADQHAAAAAASSEIDDDIPVDESTCDFEQAFEAPQKAVLGAHSSQVGALFYRRLELSAGKRPTSSGGRAAEIRKLRVQSAQLRNSTILKADRGASAHSARITPTADSSAQPVADAGHPPPRRPATATGASMRPATPTIHTTSPAQNAFDMASSEVLQKLHGSLIKAFAHSKPAAQRMLHVLLEFADSVSSSPKAPTLPATTNVALTALAPTHDCRHLDVGDVLRTEEGVTLRHGRWRSVEVLIEQMDYAHFASSWSALARIRCFHKHPMVSSPLAVLRDENSSLVYVVYTFPAMGPLVSVLRRMHAPPVGIESSGRGATAIAAVTTTALRVARCCAIGLQLMHDEGYLHRDISSQQVFDFGNGVYQLRISNRCRAREDDGGATAEGVAARWTSPDALFTGRFHPEDDVWSLGVLIWEILTRCQAIPYSECVLKDDVATALARGDILQAPEPFQTSPVWTKVAVPCFAMRLKRPALSELIDTMDKLLERVG